MIQRSGVCDMCGRSDRLTQNSLLFPHRSRTSDGKRFSHGECRGTGSVPVFVWEGPGTGRDIRFPR